MQPIDLGDFSIDHSANNITRQSALFHAARDKIISGLWPTGCRLPSTRKMAEALSLSRNTVIAAYDQLTAEGYIESRQSSGFYVCINLPEHYLQSPQTTVRHESPPEINLDRNRPFAPGVPDLKAFPLGQWQKLLQHHLSRPMLLGERSLQGEVNLRTAISQYLASSRSVSCDPSRIIITSGAQQALTLAVMAILTPSDSVLLEDPGYTQMRKVLELLNIPFTPLRVDARQGIEVNSVTKNAAKAVYLTPSNQYPMGTSLNTEQRLALIEWAAANSRWIIEDDYDSEFQFAHRPYTSLQGLASQANLDKHVVYIGSFSKVMFNGLRLGYMVVPPHLVAPCLAIKDAITGDTHVHTQAALADFIQEGHLLRHIRKMRRLYQQKYHAMLAIIQQCFGADWKVISQAAGLHVTVTWNANVTEQQMIDSAAKHSIYLRTLGYYRQPSISESPRSSTNQQKTTANLPAGLVLGFGNVELSDIPALIKTLANCFYAHQN